MGDNAGQAMYKNIVQKLRTISIYNMTHLLVIYEPVINLREICDIVLVKKS